MVPKTGKATPPPPPPPDETDEDELDEYAHGDTFCNEGDALFRVPMKLGTALDNGDEVMVRFNVEIAANDAGEAKDRASNITWDELINGMPFDSESEESIKDSLEDIEGVVLDSITVDEEPVDDDDFDVLQPDNDSRVVRVAEDDD